MARLIPSTEAASVRCSTRPRPARRAFARSCGLCGRTCALDQPHQPARVVRRARQRDGQRVAHQAHRPHAFAALLVQCRKYVLEASDARRLRELEEENSRLKKLLAEAHLDMHALKSVLGVKR